MGRKKRTRGENPAVTDVMMFPKKSGGKEQEMGVEQYLNKYIKN